MMANIILKSNKILLGAIGLLLATACSNDSEPQVQTPDPDAGREKSVVDINLSFGDAWDIDYDETRAAPPSSSTVDNSNSFDEIKQIETVKVYTFRRKEGTDDEFYYDKDNYKELNVEDEPENADDKEGQAAHSHRVAKGLITKTYGYEYRVIAIAYPKKISYGFSSAIGLDIPTDPNSWMSVTHNTYSDFCAELTPKAFSGWDDYLHASSTNKNTNTHYINKEIFQTPQIFHATLHSENNKSDIISYADIDNEGNMNSKAGLTGILRRGVAKVQLTFQPQTIAHNKETDGIQWITILAETPNSKVGLRKYDDFITPSKPLDKIYEPIIGSSHKQYTAVAYVSVGGSAGELEPPTATFYILPCTTKLAIRIKTVETSKVNTTTINIRNGKLTGYDEDHHDNGTGIVSPNLNGETFYFRRNHKYTITLSNPEKVLTGQKLD